MLSRRLSADHHPDNVRCLSPVSHICCVSNHGRPNTRRSSVRHKSWANEQRVVADADLAYAGMLQLRRCSCWTSSAAFSKRSSLESPARASAAPRPRNCSDRVRLSRAVRRPGQGLRGRCMSNNQGAEREKSIRYESRTRVLGTNVPLITQETLNLNASSAMQSNI